MADQEAKLRAFRDYDFDSDPDWAAHLKRVEIPSNDPAGLLKVKAKWYKREKDPGFDVSQAAPSPLPTSTSSQKPAQPQQPQQHSSQQRPQQQHQQQQQQQQPQQQAQGGHGGGGGVPVWLPQAMFIADIGIIVLSALYIIPLIPFLAGRAYRTALLLAFLTHLAQLSRQFGSPPLNLAGLQQWAVRALPSSSFSYAMTALLFLTGPSVSAVLPPYVVLALYSATAHAAARHAGHPLWVSHGARLHRYLTANRHRALSLVAQLEVTLGFYMVAMLLTSNRSFVLTYFVWQQLRSRYWNPESGPYHRAVWQAIGQLSAPLRNALPALEKPIAFVQRWFQSGNPMVQGVR